MAFPDPRFVAFEGIQTLFVDKTTGGPLAGGSLQFYSDNAPGVPKNVYQMIETAGPAYSFVSLGSIVPLSSIGTPIDGNGADIRIYAYPYEGFPDDAVQGSPELYFIEVYAGPPPLGDSSLQFTRSGEPPNFDTGANPIDTFEGTDNQIANPQFVEVSFSPLSGSTFTVTGTATETAIAPDWSIITNGSGTITVAQIAITDDPVASNPPYALDINSTGVTKIQLRQRLTQSPRLFANGFLAGSFLAQSRDGVSSTLTLNYAPDGQSPLLVATGSIPDSGEWTTISGTVETTTVSTSSATTGYVDALLDIDPSRNVRVTSFQFVGVENALSSTPFLQESTARQIDHLFHYYKNELVIQPKNSILTGWNFALNPWQFAAKTATTITAPSAITSNYVTDCTILVQQTNSSLQVLSTSEGYLGIQPVAAAAQGKFAVIQYIDESIIAPYWGEYVSSLLRAKLTSTHSTALQVKMRVVYRASQPVITTQGVLDNPISSWAATDPAFTAGWTAVAPVNDPVYTLTNGSLTNFSFDSFSLPLPFSSTAMLAVVLYTTNTMDSSATADLLSIERISLVPNRFAVDSQPQTYAEVRRGCFFYYESSYAQNIVPTTPIAGGCLMAVQGSTASQLLLKNFGFPFKEICRTTNPFMKFYSPISGTIDTVSGNTITPSTGGTGQQDIAITVWTQTQLSSTAVTYNVLGTLAYATSSSPAADTTAWILYHYTKDGRLGLRT